MRLERVTSRRVGALSKVSELSRFGGQSFPSQIVAAPTMSEATAPSDDDFMDVFFELGFNFDASDEFSTSSADNTPSNGSVQQTELSDTASDLDSVKKPILVKSSKCRVGAKVKITGSRRSLQENRQLAKSSSGDDLNQRLVKSAVATLYAFPSFDRSDALIYLPTSLSRHLNSGDLKQVSKLLTSHLDKNCMINMSFLEPGALNVKYLIKAYEILSDMHPDMISCATNIVVAGNKIKATLHAKFTDVKMIHDYIRATVTDPVFAPIFQKDRIEGMREELEKDGRPPEEVDHFLSMASTGEDLLVYVNMSLEMTIDDLTKKVSEFTMSGRMTSMHPVAKTVPALDA